MPPHRGSCAVALVSALVAILTATNAKGQDISPDIRTQLVGTTIAEAAQAGPNAAPPYGAPPAEPPKGSGVVTGWDNGFYIRSTDRRFSLRITGQLQADFRWYVNSADLDNTTGFLLRRARFGLEATLFQYYDFRFMPDFGSGQTRIVDGYMNVRYWDELQFTAGKFKQPFSYEQLIQDRYTPLMERSLIDQLVPARDLGVMIHGQNLVGERLDYGIAVSNGVQNGDADTNNSKDTNARVAVRPFAAWDDSPLRRLADRHLGRVGRGERTGQSLHVENARGSSLLPVQSQRECRRRSVAVQSRSRLLHWRLRDFRAVLPHGAEAPTRRGRGGPRALRRLLRPGDVLTDGRGAHGLQSTDRAAATVRSDVRLPRHWGVGSCRTSVVAPGGRCGVRAGCRAARGPGRVQQRGYGDDAWLQLVLEQLGSRAIQLGTCLVRAARPARHRTRAGGCPVRTP